MVGLFFWALVLQTTSPVRPVLKIPGDDLPENAQNTFRLSEFGNSAIPACGRNYS